LEALQELGALALPVTRLVVILRLAVLLHRGRMALESVPALRIEKQQIELIFDEGWLKEHPLSQADLEQEAKILKKVGFELRFYDSNAAAIRA
jgi:exopolyphosphatase/guanosine-5'-triphosphate,3'-diphosphate pyrophosphatase